MLGLDIGTSRTKTLVLDEEGEQQGSAVVATPFAAGAATGGSEMTVAALHAALAAVLEALGPARRRVEAVGIAGMAESGAPLDRRGLPLAPVIAWHDPRGSEAVQRLEGRFGEELGRRIGQPIRTVSSVAKLSWLVDHGVDGVARWLGVPELGLQRLTSAEVTEFSLAARTGVFDVAERRYLPEVGEELGLPAGVFPDVQPAGALMGRVSSAGSAWSGLTRGVAVTLAGHDHLVGADGSGAGDGDVVDSVGTAETVVARRPTCPDIDRARAGRVAVTVRPGGSGWAMLAGAARAGLVLGAAARTLGRPLDELDALAEATQEAVEAVAGATGAEGCRDGRAAIEAISSGREWRAPPRPAGEIWNGLLVALSERTWDAAGRMQELSGPAGRLVVFGGGSRSRPWMRAKATIGPVPVWRSTAGEAVARGAALHAGVAAGWWASPGGAPAAALEPVEPASGGR